MRSDLTDEQIVDAADIVEEQANKNPEYAWLKDKEFWFKAAIVLKAVGKFTPDQIIDVGNANKESYEDLKFALYKLRHPELTAWLDQNIHYDTILAIEAAKKP